MTQQLWCTHALYRTKCEDVEAVKQYLGGVGAEQQGEMDKDVDDMLQVQPFRVMHDMCCAVLGHAVLCCDDLCSAVVCCAELCCVVLCCAVLSYELAMST